jgi:AcrR family transcriptional regulator
MRPRALRADAERNRRKLLEVAQAVFAAEGLAVPIDEIARRAGLGIGTLYRHFPTKEALFSAIVVTRMEEVVADARALVLSDAPSEDFFAFLVRMLGGWGQKKDFIDAIARAGADLKDIARVKKELHEQLQTLLDRAQRTGVVRKDVSLAEIFALVSGALGPMDRFGITPEGRERILGVVFDGLRATAVPPKRRASKVR